MTIVRFRPLVSTNWLSSSLASLSNPRQLRVLDASFDPNSSSDSNRESYLQKHIPGSKFFDLHHCVESTPNIPRNLPDLACFTDYVRSLGVWMDTHIVAYDRTDTKAACRTWWLFRLFGHEKVSVLDGGLGKWVSDGQETVSEDPEVEVSDFTPNLNVKLLRDFDAMLNNVATNEAQVMDSRGEKSFIGDFTEPQSGHIPESKNIPFAWLFNEDGTFRSEKELQRLFAEAGIDLNKPLIATCKTAMTACGLALSAHVVGKHDVPVYYGAFTEWSNRATEELCVKGDD